MNVADEANKKNTMSENNKKNESQLDLIMEYFKAHPNEDVKHPEVVDWVVAEWKRRTGNVFRDPDRGIRSLHQRGLWRRWG